ncbi:hypothetical protein N7530_008440 [Penicillium desertorum]|uniref:Uncharacterized protein n=1 Tax=Penicillium desertorum TaxID=1303715 RepID=A0A9X0BL64_9EURO|nr:hypothetical protein N7530_008440 [Penicillium desertorum]
MSRCKRQNLSSVEGNPMWTTVNYKSPDYIPVPIERTVQHSHHNITLYQHNSKISSELAGSSIRSAESRPEIVAGQKLRILISSRQGEQLAARSWSFTLLWLSTVLPFGEELVDSFPKVGSVVMTEQ